MKISIYQINRDRDTRNLKFMGLDYTRRTLQTAEPDCAAYDKVYTGDVRCRNLEDVYTMFNINRPNDFRGHSLSVSDVVEVEDAASMTPGYYFCDSIGFREIPFQPDLARDTTCFSFSPSCADLIVHILYAPTLQCFSGLARTVKAI